MKQLMYYNNSQGCNSGNINYNKKNKFTTKNNTHCNKKKQGYNKERHEVQQEKQVTARLLATVSVNNFNHHYLGLENYN